MLSLNQIKQQNIETARKASEQEKKPYVIYNQEEIDQFPSFPFPDLGDYRPDNWKLKERFFVDSSGMGQAGEPALTVRQFKDKLKKQIEKPGTWGFAIIEQGEFQLYVGAFHAV